LTDAACFLAGRVKDLSASSFALQKGYFSTLKNGVAGPTYQTSHFLYTKFLQFLRSMIKFYFWGVKSLRIVSRQVFNTHLFFIKATDLSEASQEAVEEKLRATDRQ